jgi:signal transduction histidine kinase
MPDTLAVVSRDGTVLADAAKADDGRVVVEAVPIRRTSTDLFARLSRALGPLEQHAQDADIEFTLTRGKALPESVVVDGEKIVWVVTALVSNAMRYVRRGSRHRPGGSIGVVIDTDDGDLRIDVSDDGPGMPDAAAAVLRGTIDAHENAPALHLVSDVVRAQGGRIDVRASQDAIEHGTTITIRIKLQPPR